MALVVPRTRDELVAFYRTHLPNWESDPAAIGLSQQQVDALRAAVQEAEANIEHAEQIRQAAQTATNTMNTSLDSLRRLGSGLMAVIRGHAQATGDAKVYQDAQIPPPAPSRPMPAPQPPTDIRVLPTHYGTVTLRWEGSVRGGYFYTIDRSIDGGPFMQVGCVGAKTWTDERVPPGTRRIDYCLRCRRGRRISQAAYTSVSFWSSNTPASSVGSAAA